MKSHIHSLCTWWYCIGRENRQTDKKRGRRRLFGVPHGSKTCQYLLWVAVAGAIPEPAVCCLVTLSANCLNAARCQWAAAAAKLGPVRERALIRRPLSPHQNVWMHRLRTSRRLCNNVHSHSDGQAILESKHRRQFRPLSMRYFQLRSGPTD